MRESGRLGIAVGPAVVGVEMFGNTCFLAQIKSSLYPAAVLCFLLFCRRLCPYLALRFPVHFP